MHTKVYRFEKRRTLLPLAFLLASLISLVLTVTPAGASKTHLLQETFGSAAQPTFGQSGALAVDPSNGDLLVVDATADTLSRFHSDGTPHPFAALGTNVIDAKGGGNCATVPSDCDQTPQNRFDFPGFFPIQEQVTVDDSGTATDGNIYVTQGRAESGNVVDIFAADGSYLGQLTAAGSTKFGTVGSFPFSPCGVAVDDEGSVYVAGGFDNKIYKFEPTANPPVDADHTATFDTSEQVCSLAAGTGSSAGSIFAVMKFTDDSALRLNRDTGEVESILDPGMNSMVSVDPESGHVFVFGGRGQAPQLTDIAFREYVIAGSGASLVSKTPASSSTFGMAAGAGTLYEGTSGTIRVFGPLVTIPDVTTGDFSLSGDTSATLEGTVNPDGEPLEECKFEYGPTVAYGSTVPCAETVGEIGASAKKVHADLSGLDPESLYHYRLVAKNINATIRGGDKSFRTPGKPRIMGIWSVDVGLREATLKAQINPENSPTSYRFEWGEDATYGNVTDDIAIGTGGNDQFVRLSLDGLAPGTTYHYRLVAENGIGSSEAADHILTTYPVASTPMGDCPNQAYRSGASARLPDCRAFEMVSPVDKNGGDIKVLVQAISFPARLEQSAEDGDRFAFSSVTAFAGALSAPWTSEYLARRGPGGWSTEAINPPRELPSLTDNFIPKLDVQYRMFSPDLGEAWLSNDANPPLDECAPRDFMNLYRRDNETGRYEALIPVEPALKDAPDPRLELQGVSADGTHAVFRANAKLTPDASSANNGSESFYQLYEHIRDPEGGCGQLRLVSFRPNGSANPVNSSAGRPSAPAEYRKSMLERAVSADGSRVFFSTSTGPAAGSNSLYVRVNADQPQSTVSGGKCTEPENGCTLTISPTDAEFWTATANGSRAIYSAGGQLFEFDVDKALAGEAAKALIAGAIPPETGVAASTSGLTRVYFVSREAIDGEGEAGRPNLYLYEPGETGAERYRLVATLAEQDVQGWDLYGFAVGSKNPISNGVRMSPDGGHLAFVSQASLTGYDNLDAVTGKPSIEIYLYDAAGEETRCVSCNPSGSRPEGREFGEGDARRFVAAMMPPGQSQTFITRALSGDGSSLFFESFEALLPRDVNGKADVYQWQRAAGQADCEEAGAELYVPAAGGCLSLISSGQSSADSEIADTAPDGSNVFIRTAESLVPQDPGQVDVYDARVNGGFPQPPGLPAACEGEACQGPLAAPDDPTPASSSFHGPGNVVEGKPKPKPCRKGKVRRKGRCVPKGKRNGSHHKNSKRSTDRRPGR